MANEMIKFLRGNVANLPTTATPGAVYFTKDEGLYLGLEDGTFHRYGDFITVDDVASLPEDGAHETCMYYCVAENVLAKWDGSKWIQINKQKTLAELGGVAKSVYEAKMALLEKADTDNATAISDLDKKVGTIPATATATDIVGYIQEKTSGIATDTALAELTGRVTNNETNIKALQDALAEGGETEKAISDAQAAADQAQADVDALAGKVGTVEDGKTVVGLIETAQTQADKGVADAATAQAKADSAYTLAEGKATMDEVNTAIANAGHAVKSEVDKAISDMDAAYKKADSDMKTELEGKINAKVAQADYDAKVAELAGADTTLQGNIDALANKVGTPTEGKTIVEMIADAQTAATYDDTKVKEDIKANADAIDAIEADYLKGADKTELSNAITAEENRAKGVEGGFDTRIKAIEDDYLKKTDKDGLQEQITANANAITLLTDGADPDKVDGVKDLIDYVDKHGTTVTGMQDGIKANADAIAAINNESTGILKQAKDYADGLAGNYAEADHDHVVADITDFETVVEARITAKGYATTGYADQAEADAKAHADSLNTAMNTRVEALEAIDHDHTNKTVLDGITADKVTAWDAAEQNAKDYADDEIEKLNIGQYAKQADLTAHTDDTVVHITAAERTAWNAAEQNAKDYADGLDDAMNARVEALEAIDHSHTFVESELNLIKAGDVAKWNGAQAAAEATAAAALAAARTEISKEIDDDVKALANGAVKANTDAIAIINGTDTQDGSIAKALKDAKAYADTAESDAVATAKAYTETLFTWGSF